MTKARALLIASGGIGDFFSSIIPLAKEIEKKYELHCLCYNEDGHKILSCLPYFKSNLLISNIGFRKKEPDLNIAEKSLTSVAKMFKNYDFVYIPFNILEKRFYQLVDASLLSKVVLQKTTSSQYQPCLICNAYGFYEADLSLDIDFFNHYYHKFNISANSVLVNGASNSIRKNYDRTAKLKELLSKKGFNAISLDLTKDIRENIHLIHQVKHILTTDTSTLWIAKALSKEPDVFFANTYPDGIEPEKMLRCKNLIKKLYTNINEIDPEEIVAEFIKNKIIKMI